MAKGFLRYVVAYALLLPMPVQAGVFSLEGDFLGFFPAGTPYSVLTGSWSAEIDDNLLSTTTGWSSIRVRPSEIIFDQAQTFVPDPDRPGFDVTWGIDNTYVEMSFRDGAPTGTFKVFGEYGSGNPSSFSASGTDFELYYNDGRSGFAGKEKLSLFKYSLLNGTVNGGDWTAAPTVENTVVNGFVNLVETEQIQADQGPVEFYGGTDSTSVGGMALDFGSSDNLTVSVDNSVSLSGADIQLFNEYSNVLHAWDIDVQGSIDNEVKIIIPFDSSQVDDPNRLKVFHFDEELGQWETLRTELDLNAGQITAFTDSFSPTIMTEEPGQQGVGSSPLLTALNTRATPEPATLALFGFGLAGLAWSRRKSKA